MGLRGLFQLRNATRGDRSRSSPNGLKTTFHSGRHLRTRHDVDYSCAPRVRICAQTTHIMWSTALTNRRRSFRRNLSAKSNHARSS
jgi:hypothetical protein